MSKILGYKAFDKNLQCNPDGIPFQYEVGCSYKSATRLMCVSGFHFCINPFNVLDYYNLTTSRFAKVESDSEKTETRVNKSVTSKINIKEELSIEDFIQECINFNMNECKNINNDNNRLYEPTYGLNVAHNEDALNVVVKASSTRVVMSGNKSSLVVTENDSRIATAGNYSKIASSGNSCKIATTGFSSKILSTGSGLKIATAGNYSEIIGTDRNLRIATAGNDSKIIILGNNSNVATSGYSSQISSSGDNCVIAAIGQESRAKGKIGTWITLMEYKDDIAIYGKTFKVDGKKIKEDTFYKLENKKLVEVEMV